MGEVSAPHFFCFVRGSVRQLSLWMEHNQRFEQPSQQLGKNRVLVDTESKMSEMDTD